MQRMWDALERRYMTPDELAKPYPWTTGMGVPVLNAGDCNLLTSRIRDTIPDHDQESIDLRHYILLDMDMRVELPEPQVVTIHVEMSGNDYVNIIKAFAETGLDVASPGAYTEDHITLTFECPVEYIPSSTPGHGHLYIYHEVTTEQLDRIVVVLHEAGILNPGIIKGWEERGALCLRKPGVIKGVETP